MVFGIGFVFIFYQNTRYFWFWSEFFFDSFFFLFCFGLVFWLDESMKQLRTFKNKKENSTKFRISKQRLENGFNRFSQK